MSECQETEEIKPMVLIIKGKGPFTADDRCCLDHMLYNIKLNKLQFYNVQYINFTVWSFYFILFYMEETLRNNTEGQRYDTCIF